MCTVLDLSSESNLQRIRDYKNYHQLTGEEKAKLMVLVMALDPKKLKGKNIYKAVLAVVIT